MMKNITLIFLLFCAFANAQNVNIPDANFKSALIADTSINTNMDAEIQVAEALAFNGSIYVNNLGITDLTGIEMFTSITALSFTSNSVGELIFTDTMALTYLGANYNELTEISTRFCPKLGTANLRGNNLDSLDLSNNKMMNYLVILDNDFTQINLDSCSILGFFDGGSNDFSSIDFSNNLALTYVKMVANNLTSIDVSFLINLERLNVTNNDLTDLDLSQNLLLEELYASFNALGTVDITNNSLLEILFLADCNIENIDLRKNTVLREIYILRNQIEFLNLSNNLLLNRVVAGENPLVELDLSKHNLVTRCEMSDCPNLEALNIKNGNNSNFTVHNFTNCPVLACISVDDITYANANFTNKDATTSYNTACNYCFISYNDVDTAICAGESYTGPNAVVYTSTGLYHDTLQNACGQDSVISIDLMVNAADAVQLPGEDFCTGDTLDFYGTSITSSGTYQSTFSNTNGCDSVVSKTFTEISGVSITNNQGTLEATANMDSYQWYQDGDTIANETGASYTPTVDGDYFCEAGLNSCSFLSNTISFMIDTTGTAIREFAFNDLKVYPNPTNDLVNIVLDEQITSIKILSITGKLIQEFDPSYSQIDISNLEAGIYLLELTNQSKYEVINILKR